MTKKNKKSSTQIPLFDWIRCQTDQPENPPLGSLDIDAEFRAAVSSDIKQCPLSRHQIAARMSELTGDEIHKSMLDNWTAESHEKHRMPGQYLPAFSVVTGGRSAIETISRHAGMCALPGPEVIRAEMQKHYEAVKEHKQKITEWRVLLKKFEE